MSHQLQKTRAVQDNNNPVWNEWFTFNVQAGDDTIYFDVHDEDFSEHDIIGSSKVELKNIFDDGKFDEWIELRATGASSVSGEIHVTMDLEVSCLLRIIEENQ